MSILNAIEIEFPPRRPIPLPDSLPEVMKFNPELLPEEIRGYIEDITERQQCPIDFVITSTLCSLAGALGNKAKIKPKQNDNWVVIPNLWGALVGRPSMMKTPAMSAALEPLKKIEDSLRDEYVTSKNKYDIEKELNELVKATARTKAKEAISKSRDTARDLLTKSVFCEQEPKRKRIIINDSTVEKIGELLNENQYGLLMVRDELTGFLTALKREENLSDRSFYLESYNGDSFIYDRIGRGTIDIRSTTLSILGGLQPNRIAPLVRDTITGNHDDGFLQRFQLVVWPDDNKNWKWIDRPPNEKARESYFNAFNQLYYLKSDNPSLYFQFADSAQELFKVWIAELQRSARTEDIQPAFQAYLLKLPKTLASLSLIFHLLNYAKYGSRLIGEKEVIKALDCVNYFKSHAERLYSIEKNQGLDGAKLILKRIDKLDTHFTAREILRKNWTGLMKIELVNEALSWLVDYNHILELETPPSSFGGRPTVYYFKNKIE